MSRYDYAFVSGCRYCGGDHMGHRMVANHGRYSPPATDHLLIRMRFRAIRRELRQLMDQLPKGTKRGRL